VDYFDITYRIYDQKVQIRLRILKVQNISEETVPQRASFVFWHQYCVILKPVVAAVCANLKRLDIKGEDGIPEDQDMSMGTSLFELYLAVRQFSE